MACGGAGYDLSALTGADLLFNGTGKAAGVSGTLYKWAIRPCGVVTTPGFCAGGEFCQEGTTVSTMNLTGAGVPASSQVWGQIQLNGQYGVAQFLQDGTDCGGTVGDREGTIIYLCNSTATTPYISSILELATCTYEAVIQTAAICSQVPTTGISHTPGTPVINGLCGGGIYDLTSISNADIVGYSSSTSNYWAIRPCGVLSLTNCSDATTSICQYNPGYGFPVARYNPALEITFWQYLAPGVLSEVMMDGDAACTNQYRYSNVTYVCNAAATTPMFVSAVEPPGNSCHYYITIQTAAVCGTAFATQPAAGSSSSAAAVAGRSSSSASSVQVTVSSATSPAAAAASSPSSAAARGVSSSSVGSSSVPAVVVGGVSSSTAGNAGGVGVSSSTAGNAGGPGVSSSTAGSVGGLGVSSSSSAAPVVVQTSTGQAGTPPGGNGVAAGASVSVVAMVAAVMAAASLLLA